MALQRLLRTCPVCSVRVLRPFPELDLRGLRIVDDGVPLVTFRLACPECPDPFPAGQILCDGPMVWEVA